MITRPKSLTWKQPDIEDKNIEWYEEAYEAHTNRLIFKYYFNKKDDVIYLDDVKDEVIYKLPKEQKAKGYILAFKLISHRSVSELPF